MELRFLSKKDLRKINKLEKTLAIYNLCIADILLMRETIGNLTSKVIAMEKAINDLRSQVSGYNKEVVKYTTNNPLSNTSMEEVVSAFFDNPEIEVKIENAKNEKE